MLSWFLLHKPAEPVWLQDCAETLKNLWWWRAFYYGVRWESPQREIPQKTAYNVLFHPEFVFREWKPIYFQVQVWKEENRNSRYEYNTSTNRQELYPFCRLHISKSYTTSLHLSVNRRHIERKLSVYIIYYEGIDVPNCSVAHASWQVESPYFKVLDVILWSLSCFHM